MMAPFLLSGCKLRTFRENGEGGGGEGGDGEGGGDDDSGGVD